MIRHRILPMLAVFALVTAFGHAQTPPQSESPKPPSTFDKAAKDLVTAAMNKIIADKAFVPGVDLTKWPEFLAKQQEAMDKAENELEFSRAVNRALREIGISHIRFLAPRQAEARNQTSVVGPGFTARVDKDSLVVVNVFPDSAAAKAGIAQGDRIVSVGGKPATDADVLRGDEGSEIKVTLKHGEEPAKEITLKRERFSTVRKETLTWKGEDTAVLRVFTFSRGYGRENIEKLMTEAAKAKYLVLDLRSNGGGSTANLLHLLSLLLPPKTDVGTFISKTTAQRYVEAKQGEANDPIAIAKWAPRKYTTFATKVEPFKGKIAVLVNRGSASASEICTAALKDCAGATVVGTRSAGAVLASMFERLPYGFEIQYPMQDYVTIKGVRLEGNPIIPDTEVTERSDAEKDPAVDKAIDLLKTKSLASIWDLAA